MIDPSEDLVPLSKVAKFLPPMLRHLHVSTCIRWALRGVGNPPIKLETWKIGGRRYTNRLALERFIARLTGEQARVEALSHERAKVIAAEGRELDAEGIE